MRPELHTQWVLFTDWCAPYDQAPIPASAALVTGFLTAFPGTPRTQRRRVRAIRLQHDIAGVRLEAPSLGLAPSTMWPDTPGLTPTGVALSQMPRYGAPQRHHGTRNSSGLRGRRDACLIVLVGVLHLSRRDARQISTTDVRIDTTSTGPIIQVGDRVVPRTDTPGPCPACAITRWLRVINAISVGHRDTALDLIDVTRKDETSHDCDRPVASHTPGGEDEVAGPLLLSLSHDGWTQPGVALSTRSISHIIHARRIPTGHYEDPTYQRPRLSGRFATATAQQVYQAAGQVDDDADELLRRSQRLLALIEQTVSVADAKERR